MRPETQTIDQINAEENGDIRSIRITRYGASRYLVDSGARVVDECANDIEGTHESLLVDATGRRYFWPTCPSGKVCPPLGVPREITSCEQARVWLVGPDPFRVIART